MREGECVRGVMSERGECEVSDEGEKGRRGVCERCDE